MSGPNYLELSGLSTLRRYDVWVKAETSAGYGASSDVFRFRRVHSFYFYTKPTDEVSFPQFCNFLSQEEFIKQKFVEQDEPQKSKRPFRNEMKTSANLF